MKISLKNFRIFKNYTSFEIRQLTVLTGPNNAGKSALAKLFMLLKNNATTIDFTKGIHRIQNFEKAVNFDSKEKYFGIYINKIIPFFEEIRYGYAYEKGECTAFQVLEGDKTILSVKKIYDVDLVDISLDYKKILDIYLNREYLIPLKSDNSIKKLAFIRAKHFDVNFQKFNEIDFSNYKEVDHPHYLNLDPSDNLSSDEYGNQGKDNLLVANALFTETEKLILEEMPYALFDVYKNDEKITALVYEKILEIQEEKITINNGQGDLETNFQKLFEERLKIIKIYLEEFLNSEFHKDKIEIKRSLSQKLIFEEGFVNWMKDNPYEPPPSLSWYLGNAIRELRNQIERSEFVTINRGLQFKETDNPNYRLLLDYTQSAKANKGNFIKKALEILDFPSEIVIEQVNLLNGIGIADLTLETERGKQTLLDLGYGFSMLLPILIQIELGGSPIFIEEPEANLHPNYQSKLADIFVLASEMFPLQRIVLETHSEYLVRRLQFLTASGKISSASSIIYYFNSDNNVTSENPKIIPIEILSNGTMTEEFGPGFYDEASRLRFDLLKLDDNTSN